MSTTDNEPRLGRLFEHLYYTTGYHQPDGSPEPIIYEITKVTETEVQYGPAQHGKETVATLRIHRAEFTRDALGTWVH